MMIIDFNDVMIIALLIALVATCFWLGYKYSIDQAIENTLKVLEAENVIRMIEMPNGEIEVFSGTKTYQKHIGAVEND